MTGVMGVKGVQMPDELPVLNDETIELLSLLADASDRPDESQGAKITEVFRHLPESLNSQAAAKRALTDIAKVLAGLTGRTVGLFESHSRRGTFATHECRALYPALEAIARDREDARDAARRKRRLEWLQLATSLDRKPLRIGAYQAHAERFLATAVQRMVGYFPWLDCSLELEEHRERDDHARGVVRQMFDEGKYDFMLVPQATETRVRFVYEYSFRVLGTNARLSQLSDDDGIIDRRKLRGERLIVPPTTTSSRQRVEELLQDVDVDLERDLAGLIEEQNPCIMRLRAVTGQGLAIMSDEYTIVGGSSRDFPYLGLGPGDDRRQRKHKVDMGLLRHRGVNEPRHQAFDFVIQDLVELENSSRTRAAAQD